MSDQVLGAKSTSKPKINQKGKMTKQNQKNRINSLTPNKDQKPKNSLTYNTNKININNSTVLAPHNNNYNINNNISININIDMTNNKQKLNNTTKNKSQIKSKPIRIKKNEYKNNNSLIFNTLKNYTNKNNLTKSPFHIRIKSDNIGLKNYKFKTNKSNSKFTKKDGTNITKNANLSTTGFNPKKEEAINRSINKTTIESKNLFLENHKMNNNKNNEVKKDYSISITAEHLNDDKKLFKNKSNKANKQFRNIPKKRNNFSPAINRELLNRKQNIILNYSIGNKKYNLNNKALFNNINNLYFYYRLKINFRVNNDKKNKTFKPRYNIKDITTPLFPKNKNATLKKNNDVNSKDNKLNITSLLSKHQVMNNNNNKKDIMNYKAKSPFNNNRKEMKNNRLNNTYKNFRINNRYEINTKSPNLAYKNLNIMRNIKKPEEIADKNKTPKEKKEENKNVVKETDKEIKTEEKK